jgi:anti-sigma factor RsiW
MITLDNYEEYLVMHADGELQPHEEDALQVFLNEHPHLREELQAYGLARLVPDTEVVYANKEALLKPLPAKRIAMAPFWRTLSMAAGLAAIIVIAAVALHDGGNNTKVPVATTAVSNTAQPVTTTDTVVPQSVAGTTSNAADSGAAATISTPVISQQPKHERHATVALVVPPASNKQAQAIVKQEAAPAMNARVYLSPVAASEFKKLPVDAAHFNNVGNAPDDGFIASAPARRQTWIDRLPIEDEKKEHLNAIALAVTTGIDKASAFESSISDKKLTIKVEKRKLILSF